VTPRGRQTVSTAAASDWQQSLHHQSPAALAPHDCHAADRRTRLAHPHPPSTHAHTLTDHISWRHTATITLHDPRNKAFCKPVDS